MKLCYIANARIPTEKAHGVQIMKMCEAFALSGAEVELVVPRRLNPIRQDPFDYYGVRRIFKIAKIPCLDLIKLGRIGFLIESLSFSKLAACRAFFKKPDFIFSRDEISSALLSLFGRKVAHEVHFGRWNLFTRILSKKNSFFVAISEGLKEFYASKGVDAARIIAAHDAVDLDDFDVKTTKTEARKSLGLAENAEIIMYIGSLQVWKGCETFFIASGLAGNAQFVVIGGREEQIAGLKKEYPAVIFLGERPYKDLPVNQKAADALVIPNTGKNIISSKYTSPLKLFAHMASGRPIIASDLPSIREILKNEKNAVLVQPDRPEFLITGIKNVLENPDLAERISKQALADVRNYTWAKRAENIINFIKK